MAIPLNKSISIKLAKVVFVIYFGLTFIVTAIHIGVEIYHTRKAVLRELTGVEDTFKQPLGRAIWEFDRKQIQAIISGIYRQPTIVGLQVTNGQGKIIEKIGKVDTKTDTKNYFSHQFSIEKELDDKQILLANVRFYSDTSVVMNRVKLGLVMTSINFLITTGALLFLLFWAFNKYWHTPFNSFIAQIKKVRLENFDGLKITLNSDDDNELRLMETTFNTMLRKLELQRNRTLEIEKGHKRRLTSEVNKQTRALVVEKSRLLVTLSSIEDGVITIDTNNKILLMNRAAEKYTGWKNKEAISEDIFHVFSCVDKETEKSITIPLEMKNPSPYCAGEEPFYILMEKYGNQREITLSCSPIGDIEKKNIGFVLAFRDVTAQKIYENERLKALNLESITSLAAGVAHDYNNILTVIIGNLSLAALKIGNNNEIKPLLVNAQDAAIQAKNLTQQLSSLADGKPPIGESVKLRDVIKRSVQSTIKDCNIKCIYHIEKNLWPVDFDRDQISKAISNLSKNARAAMQSAGTMHLRVYNSNLKGNDNPYFFTGKYVVIELDDDGTGIKNENLTHIFDPYYTTKSKNSARGTGLGLSIVHSIISRHNGAVNVASTNTGGTIITIYLPAKKKLQYTNTTTTAMTDPGKKILIMDDESIVQDIVAKMLLALGHQSVIVSNGYEAISEYKKAFTSDSPFNAVILDLIVAGSMGGVEAISRLVEIDPQVVTLLSSGYSSEPAISNYQSYGFKGFIAKPFLLHELDRAINNVVNG